MSATVPVEQVGTLPQFPTVTATAITPPGRPAEPSDVVHGQPVHVRVFGSWRPGRIHLVGRARTRVPVAFEIPSTPAGQYSLRSCDRRAVRIPT